MNLSHNVTLRKLAIDISRSVKFGLLAKAIITLGSLAAFKLCGYCSLVKCGDVPIIGFLPVPITPATGMLAEARNLANRLQESGVNKTHV